MTIVERDGRKAARRFALAAALIVVAVGAFAFGRSGRKHPSSSSTDSLLAAPVTTIASPNTSIDVAPSSTQATFTTTSSSLQTSPSSPAPTTTTSLPIVATSELKTAGGGLWVIPINGVGSFVRIDLLTGLLRRVDGYVTQLPWFGVADGVVSGVGPELFAIHSDGSRSDLISPNQIIDILRTASAADGHTVWASGQDGNGFPTLVHLDLALRILDVVRLPAAAEVVGESTDGLVLTAAAGGVFVRGHDGSLRKISDGKALGAAGTSIIVDRCSGALTCETVAYDTHTAHTTAMPAAEVSSTILVSPDGHFATYVTTAGSSGVRRVRVDLRNGNAQTLDNFADCDCQVAWSANSRYLFALQADRHRLAALDVTTNHMTYIPLELDGTLVAER